MRLRQLKLCEPKRTSTPAGVLLQAAFERAHEAGLRSEAGIGNKPAAALPVRPC